MIQKLGPLLAAVLFCAAAPVCSAGTGQTYGPVRPGETLWRIAGQAYPGVRLDRDQVMLALLEANPDAVVPPCNVNGVLRVGAWLALPAPERVAALDPEAARRTVALQTSEWATSRRTGRPLDCPGPASAAGAVATPVASPPPPAVESAAAGSLRPVAPPGPPVTCPEPLPERPCPAPPETRAATSDRQVPVQSSQEHASAGAPGLTPGPRASVWLLAPLLLGLIAAALLGWERRRGGGPAEPASAAAADTLERFPARAALRLGFEPMALHLL